MTAADLNRRCQALRDQPKKWHRAINLASRYALAIGDKDLQAEAERQFEDYLEKYDPLERRW